MVVTQGCKGFAIRKITYTEVVILLLLLLFSTNRANSQTNISNNSKSNKQISHEIFINVAGLLMNNLDIQYYGEQLLNSKVTLAPLIELGYYQRVYKSWGMKIGAGGNLISYNTNFSFTIEEGNLMAGNREDNDNEYFIKNYNLFFLVNKQFLLNTKLLLNIELGLQYNYVNKNSLPIRARGYFYSQADSLAIEYFRFEIYHNNDKTDYLSLKGNINLKYRFSMKHNISAGINFNYCTDYIAKGYYWFYNLPWESSGTAKLGMNYIGLQIGYGFSF